jgi:hypothetical protein
LNDKARSHIQQVDPKDGAHRMPRIVAASCRTGT